MQALGFASSTGLVNGLWMIRPQAHRGHSDDVGFTQLAEGRGGWPPGKWEEGG